MSSPREQMLEALRAHLVGIEGVRFVDRQGLRADRLSDAQIPAILIVEQSTNEIWVERHHDRETEIQDTIILDVQLKAARETTGPGVTVSTAREALRRAIIGHLISNPTLRLQLEGEGEPLDHCIDCAAGPFRVRYMPEPEPYARFLLEIAITVDDTHDDRARTTWTQIVMDRCPPEGADDDTPVHTITYDLTEP